LEGLISGRNQKRAQRLWRGGGKEGGPPGRRGGIRHQLTQKKFSEAVAGRALGNEKKYIRDWKGAADDIIGEGTYNVWWGGEKGRGSTIGNRGFGIRKGKT